MKFIFVSPFDLVAERFWGPTLRLFMLAKELNKLGHKAYLIGSPPYNRPTPNQYNGVPLLYFKSSFFKYPYPEKDMDEIKKIQPSKIKRPILYLRRTLQILRTIKEINPDVIVINRSFLHSSIPVLLSHLITGIPLIYDWDDIEGLHGFASSSQQPLRAQLIQTITETTLSRLANVTVVASQFIKKFCRDIGVFEDRIFYAPTVADTDMFHPANSSREIETYYRLLGKKVLLYCGNLISSNGVKVENIIHTTVLLKREFPDIRVLIIGEGDLIEKNGREGFLVDLAKRLGVIENIIFTGSIPYDRVPKFVATSDLCLALFPINVITMAKSPIKVYEYMAAGKPVVARAVGEISKCVRNKKTGLLVYSDDPAEYADVIKGALRDRALLHQMGENARKDIEENFTWTHSAKVLANAAEKAKFIQATHSKFFSRLRKA